MKGSFFVALFLIAVFVVGSEAYSAGRRRKSSVEDSSASDIFLSYLKRQNKELTRTIDTFEELQQKTPKGKFWLRDKVESGDVTFRCCGCPVGHCKCCHSIKIGACCDFIDDTAADASLDDSNES